MKKSLIAMLLAGAVASAYSQGTVVFNNIVTGVVRAPVYGPEAGNPGLSKTGNTTAGTTAGTQVYTGALLTGSGFTAQLWAANGADQAEGLLQAATPTSTFRTGTAAGFFAGTTATLTGVPKDAAAATLQLRVWDNQNGAITSWAQALLAGALAGKSALFNLSAIGGDLNPAPSIAGLTSFNIYAVPEPSTFVLAGLGAAGLLIFRRRK